MSVRVTGLPSKCCKGRGSCRNDPLSLWSQSIVGAGGSVEILTPDNLRLHALSGNGGSTVKVIDSPITQLTGNNYCFSAVAGITSGLGIGAFGLATPDTTSSYIRVAIDTTTGGLGWYLIWKNGLGTSQFILQAADNIRHAIEVCRVGGFITVRFDGGAPKAFPIDVHYPIAALNPFAFDINTDEGPADVVYNIRNYCVRNT